MLARNRLFYFGFRLPPEPRHCRTRGSRAARTDYLTKQVGSFRAAVAYAMARLLEYWAATEPWRSWDPRALQSLQPAYLKRILKGSMGIELRPATEDHLDPLNGMVRAFYVHDGLAYEELPARRAS